MSEAARLRAQKAFSTDPDYLERLALHEEARASSTPCTDEGTARRGTRTTVGIPGTGIPGTGISSGTDNESTTRQ